MDAARKAFIIKHFNDAKKATKGTGIFPDTLLTQATVESKNGKSLLASKYHNYFGIKPYPKYKGQTVTFKTREEDAEGNSFYINAKFCAYNSFFEGAKGYVHFLKSNSRYSKAGVFTAENPSAQINALARAGYATENSYANILNSVLSSVSDVTKNLKSKFNPANLLLLSFGFITVYILSDDKTKI